MTFVPTQEQLAIVEASTSSSDNLLVSALAGAAKTSTLKLIANANPGVNMLYLAFNKRIVTEMQHDLPRNCAAKTLHSLGLAAWSDSIGTRAKTDFGKMGELFRETIRDLNKDDTAAAWKSMGFVLKSVGQGKGAGYVPDSIEGDYKHTRLLDDFMMEQSLPEEPSPLEWGLIRYISAESIVAGHAGQVDFDDMVFLPTVFRAVFPRYALILVDEAQDLSPLNHAMLSKLVKKRIIAVGDQNQAIYGFRGASEAGMSDMQERFDMTELTLSCSFRCPQAVVEHVQWRAPHMTWWDGNPTEGVVATRAVWSLADLPESCAIICRNNAPLFSMAIQLLQFGRYPNLWGNDVAKALIKTMNTLGNPGTDREDALAALRVWHEGQMKRARSKGNLRDRMQCMKVFIENNQTLGEALINAEHVLSSTGKIDLLTGHKSKGHEWADVYFLDQSLIGKEGQEPNLRYVIATRSKAHLTYLTSALCKEREDVGDADWEGEAE